MKRMIILCFVLLVSAFIKADIYYNFDDDTVGAVPPYLSGSGSVSDTYGRQGNSYNVNGAGTVFIGLGGLGHTSDGIPAGTLEFDVYAASDFSYFQFLLRDDTNAYKVNLRFSNGYIQDGYSSKSFGQVLTVKQWHHVKVDFNCAANSYTLTFDDVVLGSETMNSTSGVQIRTLVIDHLANYNMYYDNIVAERPYYKCSYNFDSEAAGATYSYVNGSYWSLSGTAGSVVTTDHAASGSQSLKLMSTLWATLYLGGTNYADINHGTLSFNYYAASGITGDAARTDVLFRSNNALYNGYLKIYPGINQIQIAGDGGTVVAGSGALNYDAWNSFKIDFDFSKNKIEIAVNGVQLQSGYTLNGANSLYGSVVRTLVIDQHNYTAYFDDITIETTPRKVFGSKYDLNNDGAVRLEDMSVLASQYKMVSEDVAETPWQNADIANYVVSIKGRDFTGDHFCRLGTYEFDGNGQLTVNYWNWSLNEYASNPSSAFSTSDRLIGTFNTAIAAGLPQPNFNIIPGNNSDSDKYVVSLAKFNAGTSAMVSRAANYVKNQRFIDVTYQDNNETERWYLSWQESDNIYKLELVNASYINADPNEYLLDENPSSGSLRRNEDTIATYNGADSYPDYVSSTGNEIYAAGFAFGSSKEISYMSSLAGLKKNYTGLDLNFGYNAQDTDGINNPFLANFDTFGYWNDAQTVIRYIYSSGNMSVYAYLTAPATGNTGVLARRVMYQSSHDFTSNGNIQDDPGHMLPGLAIIDGTGKFRGMVNTQFFAHPSSKWACASYWFELPTGATSNSVNDELRNGIAANSTDEVVYEENFDSYDDYGVPPASRWYLADGLQIYVTSSNAYSGKSLRIFASGHTEDYRYNYGKLSLPSAMAKGRLMFKYYVDPTASPVNNGIAIFSQDAGGSIGVYYSINATSIVDKSTNTTFPCSAAHGQWHSVELVFDTDNGATSISFDGNYIGDGGIYTANSGDVMNFTFSYNGLEVKERFLDDVVVQSLYPQTCEEMALAGFMLASDFNQDCIVDWNDFAEFAGHWLEN